jgi:cell division septum initiation protein DivIVA
MGFDPRQWNAPPRRPREVTSNLDGLLAENEALRREVERLRRQLERLQRDPSAPSASTWITAEQVQRWGEALARQNGWSQLRGGDERTGLQGLIAELNRLSFHPQLTLEQRLDRLAPGLGTDLQAAVAGPRTKKRLAVLAAFALYGVSAREWLSDAPQRVVQDLLRQQLRQEHRGSRHRTGRRTGTDERSTDQRSSHRERTEPGDGFADAAPPGADPRRHQAYCQLGLQWGASREAIKRAHRRLVKQHHPDMGGEAEAFRRINEAYQLLIA